LKIGFAGRFLPVLFVCAPWVGAQDATPGLPVAAVSPRVSLPAYTPLDLKHKYLYSLNETMGPARWVGFTIHAAVDQAEKSPGAWGYGADSFGMRVASHFGKSLLRENIAFGVRALDHEDPRYFRLGKGASWTRAKYALSRTFVARNDSGAWMPAYSRFVTTFATPMLIQSWQPEGFSAARGFRGGSIGIGVGFGSNLWQEFWPDMRKRSKFLNRKSATANIP
jgi:hypothetical protein